MKPLPENDQVDEDLERFFDLWSMSPAEYRAIERIFWKSVATALVIATFIAGIVWLR